MDFNTLHDFICSTFKENGKYSNLAEVRNTGEQILIICDDLILDANILDKLATKLKLLSLSSSVSQDRLYLSYKAIETDDEIFHSKLADNAERIKILESFIKDETSKLYNAIRESRYNDLKDFLKILNFYNEKYEVLTTERQRIIIDYENKNIKPFGI